MPGHVLGWNCHDCLFFHLLGYARGEKVADNANGQCRRLPPVAQPAILLRRLEAGDAALDDLAERETHIEWPGVVGWDWCGMFQPRPPAA